MSLWMYRKFGKVGQGGGEQDPFKNQPNKPGHTWKLRNGFYFLDVSVSGGTQFDVRFPSLSFRRPLFYKAKSRIGLSEILCKNIDHYLCVKYVFNQNIYWNISNNLLLLKRIISVPVNLMEKMLKSWVVHFTKIQLTFCFPHPHIIISIENSFYTLIWDRNWYTTLKQFQQMSTQKSRRNTPGVFSKSIKMLLIIKKTFAVCKFSFCWAGSQNSG